ncbi:hypothetical protein EsH8_XII_000067 [Colletotrichum jinshuiense]
MQLSKALFFALIGSAFAAPTNKRQLDIIQGAIKSVQDSLDKLSTSVTNVGTDANSAAPVISASTDVQNAITKAKTDISGAQVLQLQEAISLQDIAGGLTTTATGVIDNIISKKADFDKIGNSKTVLKSLQDEKTATGELGKAIVSKVPQIGQSIAQQAIDQVTAAIDKGITAYSSGGAAPAAQPGQATHNEVTITPEAPAVANKAAAAGSAAGAGGLGGILSLLGPLLGLLGGAGGAGGGAAGAGGGAAGAGGGAAGLLGGLLGGAA